MLFLYPPSYLRNNDFYTFYAHMRQAPVNSIATYTNAHEHKGVEELRWFATMACRVQLID